MVRVTIADLPHVAGRTLLLAGAIWAALVPACYENECNTYVAIWVLDAWGKLVAGASVELDKACCEAFDGDPAECRFTTGADGSAAFQYLGIRDCTLTVTGPGSETAVVESPKCGNVRVTVKLPPP